MTPVELALIGVMIFLVGFSIFVIRKSKSGNRRN